MELFKLKGTIEVDNGEANSNLDETTEKASSLGDKLSKGLATVAKVGAAAAVAAGAAFAATTKAAVEAYADYEQLVGGVDTLFKESSNIVQEYAANAYKTAGLSANEYMETVTSFSASLLQSLGGDTAKAAEVANMAITDMSDNANKMGSDMASIQDAYNGFAKQNYTMLDNLKLGYGGTQAEMQRLIDDANKVKEAMGETADLSIDSYADVCEAIHLVQTEMGITGTTAKEASATISGSVAATKSAWQNLLVGFADENANLSELTSRFIESVGTAAENIIPRVIQAFKGIVQALPGLVSQIKQVFFDQLIALFPGLEGKIGLLKVAFGLLATAIGVVAGAVAAYSAVQAVKTAMNAAEVTSLGALIAAKAADAAATLAVLAPYALVVAAIAAIIAIIVVCVKHWDEIKEAVKNACESINDAAAKMVDTVVQFVKDLVKFVTDDFKQMGENMKQKVEAAKTAVSEKFQAMKSAIEEKVNSAKQTVSTVFSNIQSTISEKANAAKSTVSNVFSSIKTEIQNKINAARDAVQTAINKIKSIMNFSWSLPKLKLPRISISGKFSLNPPSAPKFSISWYKKAMENAMILNSPTIFGYSQASGKFLGGGEAGSEVVAGSNTLMNMIGNAVAEQNAGLASYLQTLVKMLADYFPQVIQAAGHDIVTNDGVIVAHYTPMFDKALGKISAGKDRGR